ncbi:MAG: formate dehydrogenase subunit delta [Proteobacteria bacterium]|nr:formate dehydrogenase subunit delta [Pseudomonadota bacterium]
MSHDHQAQDQKLVYMANQIATFFNSQSDDHAIGEIANHITKFWDPRMRAKITAYVGHGGAGLSPRAQSAVERLPQPQPQSAE